MASAGNLTTFSLGLYSQDTQGNLHLVVSKGGFILADGTNEVAVTPTPIPQGVYWIMNAHLAGNNPGLYQWSSTANCLNSSASGSSAPDPFPVAASQASPSLTWSDYLVGAQ